MEIAKVTAEGQITVPIDVRRKLGLNTGSRLLFIENGNGFLVVNESPSDSAIGGGADKGGTDKTNGAGWSEDYIKAVMAFDDIPDFVEHGDIPWATREELR
jgi:AbrB family looped-hinge helix DNA binding protein